MYALTIPTAVLGSAEAALRGKGAEKGTGFSEIFGRAEKAGRGEGFAPGKKPGRARLEAGEDMAAFAVPPLWSVASEEEARPETDVISILEGLSEGSESSFQAQPALGQRQAEAGPAVRADSGAEEIAARMPRMTVDEVQGAQAGEEFGPVLETASKAAQIEKPCPLENENDAGAAGAKEPPALSREEAKAKAEPAEAPAHSAVRIDVTPERIAAGEQLKAPPPGKTAGVSSLFDTMVESMETMGGERGGAMVIQLRPEFLGRVEIRLAMAEGGLTARIQAEDSSVRGLINSQITQLVESLSEKGVRLADVEVTYGSALDAEGGRQENGGDRGARRRGARAAQSPGKAEQSAVSRAELAPAGKSGLIDYRA